MELGFELFQGYFFAKPVTLSGKRADPSRLAAMKLLGLVMSDADTSELEKVFKHDPALTYNLLRLVNSVGMGMLQRITSLAHAIAVLGRRQLQRWLQLLLYVHHGSGGAKDPLLQLAATRGKLMELLAGELARGNRELEDHAFMVGIMSLLDVLLSMPLEQIVEQLNLAEDVRAALLERSGRLGDMLRLTEMLERNDYEAVVELLLLHPGISLARLTRAQLEALAWAGNIGSDIE